MDNHQKVRHPKDILNRKYEVKKQSNYIYFINDRFLEWVTNHILASVILFDIALIVPLLILPAPSNIKITLGVISGSWIQLWALPALQRSQNKIQAQNEAKAEVDHETLSYLANLQDDQMTKLNNIDGAIKDLKNKH